MKPLVLSRATLGKLGPGVHVPAYDPASVTPGIVHLGLGGFHRAHMARFTHDLMQVQSSSRVWGIAGAGLLPADRLMVDALVPQDGLYTLVERDVASEAVTVIGALSGLIDAAGDSAALLREIGKPPIQIVSLTVTENGYCLNSATKLLDTNHPLIVADLAHPETPHSAIGIVTEALRRRMVSDQEAFTALSCDNIQHNGDVLRRAVAAFADRTDSGLARWIEKHARFPNTMVDRITPLTRREDVADLAARYGVVDNWPVFSETFAQWVIEDDFAQTRPDWDLVGAQFVADVAPYEFMKLRLLNTSHLAVAGLGRLAGYRFIDETMRDGMLRRYMKALMDRETGPTLPPVPGIDLEGYKARLIERFANTTLMDTVDRVNADAPLNVLLDPIHDRLNRGAHIELLALALAAWMRRVRGTDEAGAAIEVRHPMADLLRKKALEGGPDPRPLLSLDQLFGELSRDARLVAPVGKWLRSLYEAGVATTLARAAADAGF